MTFEILLRGTGLILLLTATGVLACLPLFRGDLRAFLRSSLWLKTVWWFPIYFVIVAMLYGGLYGAAVVVVVVCAVAVREWLQRAGWRRPIPRLYIVLFILCLTQTVLYFVEPDVALAARTLIWACFVSALSDVCAFFIGKYRGQHTLPAWINDHKSWEGVAGQVAGALLGWLLVWGVVGIYLPWWLAIVVGLASAAGDLFNSAAKRQLAIKDWAQTIPGHGGMLDRLSSLSFALAAVFWLM